MSRAPILIANVIALLAGCGSAAQQSSPARQHDLVRTQEAAKRRDIARQQAPQIEAARRAERERHEADVDAFFARFEKADAGTKPQSDEEVEAARQQRIAQLEADRSRLRAQLTDDVLGVTWLCTGDRVPSMLLRIDDRPPRTRSGQEVAKMGGALVTVHLARGEVGLLPGVEERFTPLLDLEAVMSSPDGVSECAQLSDQGALCIKDVTPRSLTLMVMFSMVPTGRSCAPLTVRRSARR